LTTFTASRIHDRDRSALLAEIARAIANCGAGYTGQRLDDRQPRLTGGSRSHLVDRLLRSRGTADHGPRGEGLVAMYRHEQHRPLRQRRPRRDHRQRLGTRRYEHLNTAAQRPNAKKHVLGPDCVHDRQRRLDRNASFLEDAGDTEKSGRFGAHASETDRGAVTAKGGYYFSST